MDDNNAKTDFETFLNEELDKEQEENSEELFRQDNPFFDIPEELDWEPINYLRLKCDNIMEAKKWLELMKSRDKTGLRINLSKNGIERHDIGVDRLTYLLNYYPLLKKFEYGYSTDIHLDKILHLNEEYNRFQNLDNIKKWMYRMDVYVFKWRYPTEEERAANVSRTGIIHYDRKILEIDGGYHDKWRQMAKDKWRDIDTLEIIPGVKIIRFKVDELVPESMNPNNDFASTDYDVARKVLYGRNYFSTPNNIDELGKPMNNERIPVVKEIMDNGGAVNVTLQGLNTPPFQESDRYEIRSFRVLKAEKRGNIPVITLKYSLKKPEEQIEVEIREADFNKIKSLLEVVEARPENA
jgi:hypothetical protein